MSRPADCTETKQWLGVCPECHKNRPMCGAMQPTFFTESIGISHFPPKISKLNTVPSALNLLNF